MIHHYKNEVIRSRESQIIDFINDNSILDNQQVIITNTEKFDYFNFKIEIESGNNDIQINLLKCFMNFHSNHIFSPNYLDSILPLLEIIKQRNLNFSQLISLCFDVLIFIINACNDSHIYFLNHQILNILYPYIFQPDSSHLSQCLLIIQKISFKYSERILMIYNVSIFKKILSFTNEKQILLLIGKILSNCSKCLSRNEFINDFYQIAFTIIEKSDSNTKILNQGLRLILEILNNSYRNPKLDYQIYYNGKLVSLLELFNFILCHSNIILTVTLLLKILKLLALNDINLFFQINHLHILHLFRANDYNVQLNAIKFFYNILQQISKETSNLDIVNNIINQLHQIQLDTFLVMSFLEVGYYQSKVYSIQSIALLFDLFETEKMLLSINSNFLESMAIFLEDDINYSSRIAILKILNKLIEIEYTSNNSNAIFSSYVQNLIDFIEKYIYSSDPMTKYYAQRIFLHLNKLAS